jgi:hypothetical protein
MARQIYGEVENKKGFGRSPLALEAALRPDGYGHRVRCRDGRGSARTVNRVALAAR